MIETEIYRATGDIKQAVFLHGGGRAQADERTIVENLKVTFKHTRICDICNAKGEVHLSDNPEWDGEFSPNDWSGWVRATGRNVSWRTGAGISTVDICEDCWPGKWGLHKAAEERKKRGDKPIREVQKILNNPAKYIKKEEQHGNDKEG